MIKFYSLIIVALAVIILGAFVMFTIESPHENSKIKTMSDAIWWTVATVTTVGYGDVTPVTEVGRLIAIFYMFFGIGIFAMILTSIASRYFQKLTEHEKKELEDFFVEKMNTLEENQEKLLRRFDDLVDSKK